MGVGVFHEPLNFEHTYVTCKFVGVLVGFFCKAPILWVSPKRLAFRTFVVWKKIHFFPFIFEVITKLFMVAKKCELCPPLGAYVVACVCVIHFWALWSYFSFSLFDPSSSSCDFLLALIFIQVLMLMLRTHSWSPEPTILLWVTKKV
jgi:hypothetical protein